MTALKLVLVGGQWRAPVHPQAHFQAEDPTRGAPIGPHFPISGAADIESDVTAAVGTPAAIQRFTALHSYDDVPEALLPVELRDRHVAGLQRRVDGRWTERDIGGGA